MGGQAVPLRSGCVTCWGVWAVAAMPRPSGMKSSTSCTATTLARSVAPGWRCPPSLILPHTALLLEDIPLLFYVSLAIRKAYTLSNWAATAAVAHSHTIHWLHPQTACVQSSLHYCWQIAGHPTKGSCPLHCEWCHDGVDATLCCLYCRTGIRSCTTTRLLMTSSSARPS